MQTSCSNHQCLDWALLALRVAAGIIFLLHGYGKLFGGTPGMEMFTAMVAGIGFPMPAVFAYAAALSEFVGGIAILLGVYVHVFASLTGIVMIVALAAIKKFHFPAADPDLALLSISVALVLAGSGKFSLLKGHNRCCGGACPTE